jgi:hypothetical protein
MSALASCGAFYFLISTGERPSYMIFDTIAICIFLMVITLPITGYLAVRWGWEQGGEHPWNDHGYKN